MPTILVTGANRGLGLEFARQYAADGWRVIATCRDPAKAGELKALPSVEVHALDVADIGAGAKLASSLAGTPIDLLLNNAGVYGARQQALGNLDAEDWLNVLRVNSVAPLKLAEAFLPHLRAGKGKTAAFVTSLMGSIADNGSGRFYAYRSSKAALNAAVKSFAVDTAADGLIAVLLHPGWVQTDMGGPGAPVTPKESIAGMRKVLAGLKAQDSGRFFAYDGKALPW
ncbi:MAG TPA: SDR family oxidoreductase [Alphaproteobacteria bacterium]|jgi:NAD(P)-dependent dehydrogenase (short-subunit alcohol dehydrogenase family)